MLESVAMATAAEQSQVKSVVEEGICSIGKHSHNARRTKQLREAHEGSVSLSLLLQYE